MIFRLDDVNNNNTYNVIIRTKQQVQGHSKLLPERYSDSPYDDFFKEVAQAVNRISEKLQLKLNEADIYVEKYIEKFKGSVEEVNEHFQESLQTVSFRFFLDSL